MYAVSYTAAIVLAGFWTTVSVFSQSFARSHYKPPMIVVMKRKPKRVEAPKKKTRRVQFELPSNYSFGADESETHGKKVKAPKLIRSLTTFVGTHRRCSVDSSSDGSSESDTSSISSSDSLSSSSSSGSRLTRPTFRRAKTSPARQERKAVSWADDTEGEM